MKKIIFILIMSLIVISCGNNNTNSVEESEELIEYVDTFNIDDIIIEPVVWAN